MANLIIIAGMPATGKTTVSKALQKYFDYPIVEKDLIKEELFDTLGFENYQQKRNLDHASNAALLYILEEELRAGRSLMVVNNFDKKSAERLNGIVRHYNPRCLSIVLHGDEEVLYRRYVDRDNRHLRHLGHIVQDHYPLHDGDSGDYTMTREEFNEKFVKRGMDSVSLPGERLDIDATDFTSININSIVDFIKERI